MAAFARACVLSLLGALALGACGPVQYASQISTAESTLAEARDANARWFAPYDYYYAEAHLAQARVEAAEASYENAIGYAETAQQYARRALRIATVRGRFAR